MSEPLRVAVLCSGSGTNLQSILDHCEAGRVDAEVVAVISDTEDAHALDRAKRHGADPLFVDPSGRGRREHEGLIADALDDRDVELVVLAGWLRILTDAFVDRYRWRMINIHPSLLPLFGGEGMYGVRVHEAALKAGVRFTGATTHFVTEDVDQGPIILQAAVPVRRTDTPRTLQQRVLEVEHAILPRTVDLFAQDRLEVVDGERVKVHAGDTWEPDPPDAIYSEGY